MLSTWTIGAGTSPFRMPPAMRQPMPNRTGTVTPRFGWSGEGHRAIEQAGIHLMKPSSYRAFLIENLPVIHDVSLRQDQRNSGPDHFVNLESYRHWTEADSPPALPTPSGNPDRHFSRVEKRFSPNEEKQRTHQLKEKPLQAREFEQTRNVFNSCLKEYRHLVQLLRTLNQMPPRQPGSKAALGKNLTRCVGSLAHYVGDLNQPQHTTRYYTWQLTDGSRKNAHSHLERDVISGESYTGWRKGLKARESASPSIPNAPLQETGVISRLLGSLKRSHLALFALVDGERQARTATDASHYLTMLNQAWRPIMETRLDAAATDLTALLESAYAEAGSPELPQPFKARSLDINEHPFLEPPLSSQKTSGTRQKGEISTPLAAPFADNLWATLTALYRDVPAEEPRAPRSAPLALSKSFLNALTEKPAI